MQEIDVIRATRSFPQRRGLMGSGVLDLFTDAHPTRLSGGDDGQTLWHKLEQRHFRSTTFLQHKSVLKYAGIVTLHALGGASARGYDPDRNIWELSLPHGEAP